MWRFGDPHTIEAGGEPGTVEGGRAWSMDLLVQCGMAAHDALWWISLWISLSHDTVR